MNIWYWHHYAGSPQDTAYGRPYFLAKAMSDEAANCRVFSASYHHLMRKPVDQKEPFVSDDIDGVCFTWVKTSKYSGNGLGRFKNMLSYAWQLWKRDPLNIPGIEVPDAIIVSSAHPFHIFAGIRWSRKYQAKLLFEVRDLWPLSLQELLKLSKWHPAVVVISWLERLAYKKADMVVSLLPNAVEHMIAKGMAPEKFKYIPNGIRVVGDSCAQDAYTPHDDFLKNLKSKNKFILLYTGAHGIPNAMDQLLEAAELLQNRAQDHIKLVLIGDGHEKARLINRAKSMELNNLFFLDSVPRAQVPTLLEYADATFIGANDSRLYEYGVSPNKMFEYMLAAKPVVAAIRSPNNPIEISGGGVCVDSNRPEELANVIEKIAYLPEEERKAMGQRGHDYLLKHHDYKILARKYLDIIKSLDGRIE